MGTRRDTGTIHGRRNSGVLEPDGSGTDGDECGDEAAHFVGGFSLIFFFNYNRSAATCFYSTPLAIDS